MVIVFEFLRFYSIFSCFIGLKSFSRIKERYQSQCLSIIYYHLYRESIDDIIYDPVSDVILVLHWIYNHYFSQVLFYIFVFIYFLFQSIFLFQATHTCTISSRIFSRMERKSYFRLFTLLIPLIFTRFLVAFKQQINRKIMNKSIDKS